MKGQDLDYIEKYFPKGDKRRGEAMVLLALARIEGREELKKQQGFKVEEKDLNKNCWDQDKIKK